MTKVYTIALSLLLLFPALSASAQASQEAEARKAADSAFEQKRWVDAEKAYLAYSRRTPPPKDIDCPGHLIGDTAIASAARPQGTIIFRRLNFIQYASYNDVRCSNEFTWFVRLTTQKTSPVGVSDFDFYNRPNHANDNLSGMEKTSLSID